ncbi:MAG TPA: MaoC/PaaZ C-terminal domain-containing protein [Streptosporangiaceae bacterium]|nr:MaoC/PaaZ C-terminal domain-containing protein [Streptosporangiaceae bacterium]
MNDHGLRYFEDYAPGAIYECGGVSVDAASIVSFGKEFDPQTFHVDPVVAAGGPFGGLIASGRHTAALTMRLLVDNYLSAEASLAGAGVDEIRWPFPVRAGDTLRVRAGRPDGHAVHRDQPPARPPGRGIAE